NCIFQAEGVGSSRATHVIHFAAQVAALVIMLIVQTPKTIRQAEYPGPHKCADTIWDPFCQKINARLAAVADVGAQVEQCVGGHWLEAPFSQPSPETRTHAP